MNATFSLLYPHHLQFLLRPRFNGRAIACIANEAIAIARIAISLLTLFFVTVRMTLCHATFTVSGIARLFLLNLQNIFYEVFIFFYFFNYSDSI